jgi:hypothetical protein
MSPPQDALNIATATAASVQALAAALQQHTLQPALQTKVTLPPFWSHDLAAWFQHIEAEFIIPRVPLTSYLCYLHVIRALPADVVTAVRDVTSTITAESVNAYDAVKQALLKRFTPLHYNAVSSSLIHRRLETATSPPTTLRCGPSFPPMLTFCLTPFSSAACRPTSAQRWRTMLSSLPQTSPPPPLKCNTQWPPRLPLLLPHRSLPRRRHQLVRPHLSVTAALLAAQRLLGGGR